MIGTASSAEIHVRHRQLEALKQQMAEVLFDKFLAIREVLTPTQRRSLGQPYLKQ